MYSYGIRAKIRQYNHRAVVKYTAKPSKSFAVVIKGPDATAGFILNLSKMIGVIVPIREASITTDNKAIATTSDNFIFPSIKYENTKTIAPMTKPFKIATTMTFIRRVLKLS
jgi:hypothetical protein